MLERIASNLSSESPQDILNPAFTTSTSPSKAAAPINSSPQGDSSNLVQNKGSSNMAVLAGASEQQDDQSTSPPLKETNEATLHESAEASQRTSLQKSPLETLQEDPKDAHAEGEKADSG
ncbi:unnamed protein product [Vicia faba]|uniref:Uncharacterized protein n=1 Tax=Vicia faba TaxID=3906 RepID=A0AAV1A8L4_VICFA|nr:unnamed protein product [Vicia faba]